MARASASLTAKQIRFVEAYLINLNATAAAISAGYSRRSAAEQGYHLLSKPAIAAAIAEAQAERMKRTEVYQRQNHNRAGPHCIRQHRRFPSRRSGWQPRCRFRCAKAGTGCRSGGDQRRRLRLGPRREWSQRTAHPAQARGQTRGAQFTRTVCRLL